MAPRDERMQFEIRRDRECVAVVSLGALVEFRVERDLAKKVEGTRFAATLATVASHGQGSSGISGCLRIVAGEHMRFAERHQEEGLAETSLASPASVKW